MQVALLLFLVLVFFFLFVKQKPHNSLVQFGYSLDLLKNPEELEYLKMKIEEKPEFHLSLGSKYVFAKNGAIMINGYAGVAKLSQFTSEELELIEVKQKFSYHSIDNQGIWFEIITNTDLDRVVRKPYPFR